MAGDKKLKPENRMAPWKKDSQNQKNQESPGIFGNRCCLCGGFIDEVHCSCGADHSEHLI